MDNGSTALPYWKDYQVCILATNITYYLIMFASIYFIKQFKILSSIKKGNAIRGVIAAVCCAVFFILLGLVYKFRWRSFRDDDDNDEKEEISGAYHSRSYTIYI